MEKKRPRRDDDDDKRGFDSDNGGDEEKGRDHKDATNDVVRECLFPIILIGKTLSI